MDLTTASISKTLGNGQTVEYTYWRATYADADGVPRQ